MKHYLRSLQHHFEFIHHHHGKKLAHTGKIGVAAEGLYHAAELAGAHSGTLIAAGVLLVLLIAKVMTGGIE